MREILIEQSRSGKAILNSLKNQIARDVMSVVNDKIDKISVGVTALSSNDYPQFSKNQVEKAYELYDYKWKKKIDRSSLADEELAEIDLDEIPNFDVSVVVVRNPERQDFNVAGFSATATDGSGVDIIIELPSSFPAQRNEELRNEIGNTVLHELEHLTQDEEFLSYGRGREYYDFDLTQKPDTQFAAEKFLTPAEVSAHVTGYSDASTSLQDLEQRIVNDLARYVQKELITQNDKDLIINAYMDWASRNLKAQRFQP